MGGFVEAMHCTVYRLQLNLYLLGIGDDKHNISSTE